MHQDDINGINALYGIAVSTSAYEFDFLMISNPYQKSLGLFGQLIRPLFALTEEELHLQDNPLTFTDRDLSFF